MIISLAAALTACLFSGCEGMYDNMEKFYGEVVYPAKYDTPVAHIGYERAEIDLLKAGRIPSEQIRMGKAKKTVIEYDDERIVIDRLVSWVNLTGLTQSKIYRIQIYTMDEYENRSVPQEVAVIPYTSGDLATLAVVPPQITASADSAVVEWPHGFGNTTLLTCLGLSYSYTDRNGHTVSGESGQNARFIVENMEPGKSHTVNMRYRVIPKINNASILDTLVMERTLTVNLPAAALTLVEKDMPSKDGLHVQVR